MATEFGKRLKAAREHAGLTQDELAAIVGLAQSTIASAEARGDGSRKTAQIAAACKVRPAWLASGEGAMTDDGAYWTQNHHPLEGAEMGAPLAQETSHPPYIVAPTLEWEQLMSEARMPAEFYVVLKDDAMAPIAGAGVKVKFRRGSDARPGDGVLIQTADGSLHFREYRQGSSDGWTGYPANPAYRTLIGSAGTMTVVAIFTGIDLPWSRLQRF